MTQEKSNASDNDIANRAKVRCYASKAGLTIEATSLMKKNVPIGYTVNIDVAPRNKDEVDWSNKITVQVSETELPIFASVMLGYLPKAHFKRSDKGIFIERQKGKTFISATQGAGKAYALPVPIGQSFQIADLLLKQLKAQSHCGNSELILAALRGSSALYKRTP